MANYTERVEVDEVRINPQTGHVGWRETTVVLRDGVEVARTYHRGGIDAANADLPAVVPPEVEKYRALAQTPDVVAAAKRRAEEAKQGPKV